MELKRAAALAARFAGKVSPFDRVILEPGRLYASGPTAGVAVKIDAEVDCAVDAQAFAKTCAALAGTDHRLTYTGKAGLKVAGGTATFTLKAKPAAGEIVKADPVTGPDLPAANAAAVRNLARLIEPSKVQPQLAGLRFTPRWVGGATQTAMWVVWAETLGDRATVDPTALLLIGDLDAIQLSGDGRRLAARHADVDAWLSVMAGEYPDAAIEGALAAANASRDSASVVKIDVKALRHLCTVGLAAQTAPADLLGFGLRDGELVLVREPGDAPGFEGSAPCAVHSRGAGDGELVGLSPDTLLGFLRLCDDAGDYYLALSGSKLPVMLWGGDPVIQCLAFPGYR